MDDLQKAYLGVYESYLETDMKKRKENNEKAIEDMKKTDAHKDMVATVRKKFDEEVETDLFDYLLEYLVAEGYANTNENAIAIMANMSEEWKKSIVEQELTARQKYLMGKVEKMNKKKSGSAHTYVPGKQNVGGALDRANRSAMQMRGEK
jgi:hypothetical protein